MRRTPLRAAFLTALLLPGLAGCAELLGPRLPEDDRPLLVIVERNAPSAGGGPNILVKRDPDSGECGTIYQIQAWTVIGVRVGDGELRSGEFDDLRVGHVVRVWGAGVHFTSCPGQMAAMAVEALGDVPRP